MLRKVYDFFTKFVKSSKGSYIFIDGNQWTNVREYQYLGVIICNDFKDDNAIRKEVKGYTLEPI